VNLELETYKMASNNKASGKQMKGPNIKGVLFDFDGTLTLPGALDFPDIKRELDCPLNMPILEFLETAPAGQRERLSTILEAREEEAACKSIPNQGAETCLLQLKQKGILIGILTRNRLKSVCGALKQFDHIREKDFDVIITRDDSLPKPDPDGVLKAAQKMGIKPDELMVVGDFRFDVMAGKAAGAYSVLLTNGGKSVMAPGDPEPDWIIGNLSKLIEILA
jgi:HAD superfamily hydrolase (TIGR01509 family)